MLRRILLAATLVLGLAPALAQAPPPVPALPDTARITSYSISGTTCICAVGFALYGDGTDVDAWIEVWINNVQHVSSDATFGWSLSSPTGSLGSIPRPITDAVLTFNNAQTGTVQIVGARRPRRTSQFSENQGVAARDFNQALTDLTAQNREVWDKINDVTGRGIFFTPGNSTTALLTPSQCAGDVLGFDGTGLKPECINPTTFFVAPGPGAAVATMATLKNLAAGQYSTVWLRGYYADGDGGEGMFVWNASSTATDDAGVVVQPISLPTTGRWIRSTYSTLPNIKWWGAHCDYNLNTKTGTDDSSVFNHAISWAETVNGADIAIPRGAACAIANTIDIAGNNISFYGVGNSFVHNATYVQQMSMCGALLAWTGSSNGWMFFWFSAGTFQVDGGGLRNLCLDGHGQGGIAALITSARAMDFKDLYFENWQSAAIQLDVNPNYNGGNPLTNDTCDTQFNTFDHIMINQLFSTTGFGIILESYWNNSFPSYSSGGCNTSLNIFRDMWLQMNGAVTAISARSDDHDYFYNINYNRGSGGTAYAVDLTRSNNGPNAGTAAFVSGNDVFMNYSPGIAQGAIVRGKTSFPSNTVGNATFVGFDGSGTGSIGFWPTVETGALVSVFGAYNQVTTFATTVAALPTCAAQFQGMRMFVTDQATATAYHGAVTGGGSGKQAVVCDGTNWYQN